MTKGLLYSPPTNEQIYQRNTQFVRPGDHTYNTVLPPMDELLFRGWLQKNGVPFNPEAPVSDYDMRGFYRGLMQGDPKAKSAIDPNDNQLHYPDWWKTPYHETFSNESQWANPNTAPSWTEDDKLVTPAGRVLFDDRARQ